MVALGNGQSASLPGATAATRYAGGTASGAPISGTFAVGDFVIDQTGEIWICTAAGTPGTWAEGATGAQFFAPTGLTGATSASRYVGATASGAPISGTFAVGDFVIDRTGIMWICVTAGTPGTWVNAATAPAVPWLPADTGYLAANMDPMAANNVILVTGGTQYLMRVDIRTAFTWTNVVVFVTTAGNNTLGSSGTFVGLYSSAGVLLSGSADVAASLTSTGAKALPLTTPQPMTPGTFVWACIMTNLGTTQPTLQRSPANPAGVNGALAAGFLRSCVNGTGRTTLQAPITPGSNTATNSQPLLVAAT